VRLFHLTHWVALGVTLAVECACMALAAWTVRRDGSFVGRAVTVALAVNLVSHTLFWMSYPWLAARDAVGLLGVEGLVTLAEAVVYWRACPLSFATALLLSLVLNTASFVVGGAVWTALL
jgi:hypothetical protein